MKTEFDTKINEAEVCRSMGLLVESLHVYEEILDAIPELDEDSRAKVNDQIQILKQEIQEQEEKEGQNLTQEEISIFRETLSDDESISAILDGASAFKLLGLHAEAIAEYKKVLPMEYPLDEVVPEIADCLLQAYSPTQFAKAVDSMLGDNQLTGENKATIKFLFGNEMERRDHRDIALNLYKAALRLNPEDSEIKSRVDTLAASSSAGSKYDYLLKNEMVTTDQLQKSVAMSRKMNKSVEFILIQQYQVPKEEIGKSFSAFYGCPFRVFDESLPIPFELLKNLKESFLMTDLWVPLSWDKDGVEILIDDPRNLNKSDNIRALTNQRKIKFAVAIREDIEAFVKRFFHPDSDSGAPTTEEAFDDFDLIPDVTFEEEEEEEVDDELTESSSQVVKLVDQFLIAAYRKSASDIHVEPSVVTKATTIRFRIDGVCQEYIKVPNVMARGMLSRLKIMSGLDIAERRLPQDGKIKFKRKGVPEFELRVATLPTAGGFEDSVLRILAKAGAMKLDEMGMNERNQRILESIVAKPYGLVLVVGPTGSGKTTSLHAALGHINKPGVKIWTAEDPIEITQVGLRQVEAKPKIGLDFARIMRAFLRADPDVIMIGEMRDEETASIGVEASLTGHLVFSTLHTNSAPETVTRLLDMGLNPLNFSDAFLGVMAQRLLRRLCSKCKEEYHPDEEEFQDIVTEYGEAYFPATGIEYGPELKLYRAKGCDVCGGTGYKGRMGIHELMEGTKSIKRMIKKQATAEELFEQSMKEGMSTLKQDGLAKSFQGITDFTEVRRVCIE